MKFWKGPAYNLVKLKTKTAREREREKGRERMRDIKRDI